MSRPSRAHARAPRHGARRWVVRSLGIGVGILMVLGVSAFAWDGVQIRAAARELEVHAAGAKQALTDQDTAALVAEVAAVDAAARQFAEHTSGPHWAVAGSIPWVKDQTLPLERAGDVVLALSEGTLVPLSKLDGLDAVGAVSLEGERIDPTALDPFRETLTSALVVVDEQLLALAVVDLSHTVDAVRAPLIGLKADLRSLREIVEGGAVASQLLPPMLGADGPRTYVVAVQNNAEPRSTGGIPGALLGLTVDDGRFAIASYVAADQLYDGRDVAPLTDDELALYTSRMAQYPQDTNFSPDYPRTAALLAAFWERETGTAPDGVISIDPVALGYMLSDMEPLDVNGVRLTGANLSEVLLRDSYLLFPDPDQQDVFFAAASRALFARIFESDSQSVFAGMERASGEHRLMVWSARPEEQGLLEDTGIAGDFLARRDSLGIFLNDGSGSKIGYYVEPHYAVVNRVCPEGKLAGSTVTVTLTQTFAGDVDALPQYVSGDGVYVPFGEFHANLVLYPPVGMGVSSFTRDGTPDGVNPGLHDGRTVAQVRVSLKPGESTTLRFDLTPFADVDSGGAVVVTPDSNARLYSARVAVSNETC